MPTQLRPTPSPTSSGKDCALAESCANDPHLRCTGEFCWISCGGYRACASSTIVCDGTCLIYCNGQQSCQNTLITLTKQSILYLLRCGTAAACQGMEVIASRNATIQSWQCTKHQSCKDSRLWCRGSSDCSVFCGMDDSCSHMDLYCLDTSTVCDVYTATTRSNRNITLYCDNSATCQCENCTQITMSPIIAPTFQPTVSPIPTMSPTLPTLAPTSAPTIAQPTSAPVRSPTKNPTTKRPTKSPTLSPSDMPTPPPTFRPSGMPTYSPTKQIIPIEVTDSRFSSDSSSILIQFSSQLQLLNRTLSASDFCTLLLRKNVATFSGCLCFYQRYLGQNQALRIVLSSRSSLVHINDTMVVSPRNLLASTQDNATHSFVFTSSNYTIVVQASDHPLFPQIRFGGYHDLGWLDDLMVTALSSLYLGYRTPNYQWDSGLIKEIDSKLFPVTTNISYLYIPYDALRSHWGTYNITLTITTVLGYVSSSQTQVTISDEWRPLVKVFFNPRCFLKFLLPLNGNELVKSTPVNTGTTNGLLLPIFYQEDANGHMNRLYSNSTHFTFLITNVSQYQVGTYEYLAEISLLHNNAIVGRAQDFCIFGVVHSPLDVVIQGGDRVINLLEVKTLVLNGSKTRDPDNKEAGIAELSFHWTCQVLNEQDQSSCDFMDTVTTDSDVFSVDSNELIANVVYQFALVVVHSASHRQSEADVFIRTYVSSAKNSYLFFSIYASSTVVGRMEKLTMYGPSTLHPKDGYVFKWSAYAMDTLPDITWLSEYGVTSTEDIVKSLTLLSTDGRSSCNLILAPNTLTSDTYYVFELTITIFNSSAHLSGSSYAIVYVLPDPIITNLFVYQQLANGTLLLLNDMEPPVSSHFWLHTYTIVLEHVYANVIDRNTTAKTYTYQFFYFNNNTVYSTSNADELLWIPIISTFQRSIRDVPLPCGRVIVKGCVTDEDSSQSCTYKSIWTPELNISNGECQLRQYFQTQLQNTNEYQMLLLNVILDELKQLHITLDMATKEPNCTNDIYTDLQNTVTVQGQSVLGLEDLEALIRASARLILLLHNLNATISISNEVVLLLDIFHIYFAEELLVGTGLVSALEELMQAMFDPLPQINPSQVIGDHGNCFHNNSAPTQYANNTLHWAATSTKICAIVHNIITLSSIWLAATLQYVSNDEVAYLQMNGYGHLSSLANQFKGIDGTDTCVYL
ncbi:hypothetical protein RFI_24754 [Reticulomyxa filosa]|uniref:PKD/REJ-like domain-containing protein n=1 Tax=Reticulomyxa filosa TaxID=46433 RepID=X6MHS8_RETFI|nr:hypothetical protein RFI_24754 [Reticulomyxa filosa]|eukprot:ETO12625.1 hypothetical protein RFI_24754 [Reticulomyxa filosa]